MILVDSSVWIDFFRGAQTPQVERLDGLLGTTMILVGDLIVAEVLQGVRDEREFQLVRRTLDAFEQVDFVGKEVAIQAARNFRKLRDAGITIRKTIDTLIATRCIESNYALLHSTATSMLSRRISACKWWVRRTDAADTRHMPACRNSRILISPILLEVSNHAKASSRRPHLPPQSAALHRSHRMGYSRGYPRKVPYEKSRSRTRAGILLIAR